MKAFNTAVLSVTVSILDFLYRGQEIQRFWVLETIARAPYFAFLSVLHFKESLGLRTLLTHIRFMMKPKKKPQEKLPI